MAEFAELSLAASGQPIIVNVALVLSVSEFQSNGGDYCTLVFTGSSDRIQVRGNRVEVMTALHAAGR